MHEMNYQGGYRDEPPPLYTTYNNGPSGQKLTGFVQSTTGGPSAGQRLALAIISLILWMGMFMFVIFGIASTVSSDLSSVPKFLISVILVFGMLLFTALVIFLNALFTRSKR